MLYICTHASCMLINIIIIIIIKKRYKKSKKQLRMERGRAFVVSWLKHSRIMEKLGGKKNIIFLIIDECVGYLTTSTLISFYGTSSINLNILCCVCSTWWWSYTILNFRCHRHECLLNIRGILCWRFKEWNSKLIGVFLQLD